MRISLRPTFLSERRPRVHFYTSNDHKFMQARSVFDICGLALTHFRSRQDPYDEAYDKGGDALLRSAVAQVKSVIGHASFFFVEDTSIRVEALSSADVDTPGLAAKEWFAATSFEELDAVLRVAQDRRATVRSDIALHVPGVEPVLLSGMTSGVVADHPPDFPTNPTHPWLTPDTFNGWFIPDGASRPLGAMKFEESLEYDFRVKALVALVDRLEEYTAVVNLAPSAFEKVGRGVREPVGQVELFASDKGSAPKVVMVTGYTCAGKTEFGVAAESVPDVRYVEASGVLRQIGASIDPELGGFELAERVLGELGPDIVARVITEKFLPQLSERTVVITGFRTIEEVAHVRRLYPDARLLFVQADERTRLQRQIQRARKGSVSNMEDLRRRDREQESFGLLAVGEDLADDLLENDGTSDSSLETYHKRVRALLKGAKRVPKPNRNARPRPPLSEEGPYRCLHALRRAGSPLTAPEISRMTEEEGWGIEQRNINQALRLYPQFAVRTERAGADIVYDITKAGLAYLTQREAKDRSVATVSAN